MSTKIIEKLIEPVKVETGSIFKLKIKAIRYLTYAELQQMTYRELKNFTYKNLKGD